MSRFLSELQYKPSDRDGFFLLTAPMVYLSDKLARRVKIESGFETNFVTGRKLLFVRRIVQDKMNAAAVVHDKLYSDGSVPRDVADAVFYEAMRVSGVAAWRARLAWTAVRIFGGQFYNQQPAVSEPTEA